MAIGTAAVLFGAQIGVSLLQGRASARAAAQQQAMAGIQGQLSIDRAIQEAAFAREGLQIGAERSVLQAILSREQAATAAIQRTEFAGPLERAQIRREAKFEERQRRGDLAQALGAQRASYAAAGAVGGRTQRLAIARSQSQFAKEQLLRTQRTREAVLVSSERDRAAEFASDRVAIATRFQERAAIQDLRRGVQASFMQQGAAIENAQLQMQGARQQASAAMTQAKINVLGSTLMAGSIFAANVSGLPQTPGNNRPPDFRQW